MSLVVKLRGHVLGHLEVELVGSQARTLVLRLSTAAKKRLQGAGGDRIVVLAVATDPDGRRAKARSRVVIRDA